MSDPETKFIEDPQIAASIDDLKRRWPAIGEAANHPMTEYFIARDEAKARERRKHPFKTFSKQIGISDMGKELVSSRPRARDIDSPRALLTQIGDVGQWEQFWMVPLSLESIAGMIIGSAYHKTRVTPVWKRLLLKACPFVVTYICIQSLYRLEPQLPASNPVHDWNFIQWAVVAAACFVLSSIFFKTVSHEKAVMRKSVVGLRVLIRASRGSSSVLKPVSSMDDLILFVLIGVLNWMVITLSGHFLHVSIAIVVTLALYALACRQFTRVDSDAMFKDIIQTETPYYWQHIGKIIKR